jgi:hypothetical protein
MISNPVYSGLIDIRNEPLFASVKSSNSKRREADQSLRDSRKDKSLNTIGKRFAKDFEKLNDRNSCITAVAEFFWI